jgi:hypothetical protein
MPSHPDRVRRNYSEPDPLVCWDCGAPLEFSSDGADKTCHHVGPVIVRLTEFQRLKGLTYRDRQGAPIAITDEGFTANVGGWNDIERGEH